MDFEKMTNSKFYTITDWLYKLFIINAFCFFFSVLGFIVFSVFPAIITVYLLINELIHGKDFPLLKTFFTTFKKVYFRAQKLFLIYGIAFGILALNFNVYSKNVSPADYFHQIGILVTLFLGVLVALSFVHIIPLFIYFPNLTTVKLIMASIKVAIAYPITTLLMILAYVPSTLLSLALLPSAAFISISIPAFLQLMIIKPKYARFKRDNEMLTIDISK